MNQRYHKLLLTEDLLKLNAKYLSDLFQFLWLKYTQKQIADTEFCALYLLSFQLLRCTDQPFVGFQHPPLCKSELVSSMSLQDSLEMIGSYVPSLKNHKDLSQIQQKWPLAEPILSVLNCCMLKGIPRSGIEPLIRWHSGDFPLFLLSHIPSASELLQFQIEGRRCVTALITETDLLTVFAFGRDPFSFLLHDFFHAEHFMGDPENFKAQIGFSKLMGRTLEIPVIQKLIATDLEFKKDFEYLYADMNAQVCYLLITFRAILWKAFDRNIYSFRSSNSTPFDELQAEKFRDLQINFADIWILILNQWNLPEQLKFLYELNEEIFTESTSDQFCEYLREVSI
jgi:hypothetical protein